MNDTHSKTTRRQRAPAVVARFETAQLDEKVALANRRVAAHVRRRSAQTIDARARAFAAVPFYERPLVAEHAALSSNGAAHDAARLQRLLRAAARLVYIPVRR